MPTSTTDGQDPSVFASGNLASPRRIIAGVLGQFQFFDIDRDTALEILTGAGLPARALDEPDFPISLQQELEICAELVDRVPAGRSPTTLLFEALPRMGIENLGVIGMAMRHAATALESLKICLEYPQLTMGHCRMIIRRMGEITLYSFSMERPQLRDADEAATERLVEYCQTLDLLTSLRNIEDIVGTGRQPTRLSLPQPEPPDWGNTGARLDFPVKFAAGEACIAYPVTFDDTPLPKANPLVCKMYLSLADRLSQLVSDDMGLEERVLRWLWAYTPPLKRGEIAELLAMSERNLTRQLANAGTSYSTLLAQVQAERARNLLRNREMSVSEISDRLGYSEPAAFTRAFTHWTGQSPLKWRSAHQTT